MSHRRSSSLTGSARVSDAQAPPPGPSGTRPRPPPPIKASSLDVGDHGAATSDGSDGRQGRSDNLAHAAKQAYEVLELHSENIIQRFDDSIDELESGPLVQTAKATVQKVATVIEKPVGRIKQSRFVEEVSGVINEIENTEVVQVAKGKARQAYLYVEPISEKILSRMGSLEDENAEVQFVIPPSMQRPPGKAVVEVTSRRRPLLRQFDLDRNRVKIDPSQYDLIQEDVPAIHVSGVDGRDSVLPQGVNCSKDKAPDQISIVSATDSERQYELVRPHRLYLTPPLPPPKPRRSWQAKISNNGVKNSLLDENSEKQRLLDNKDGAPCECGPARSVRFSEATQEVDGTSIPPANLSVKRLVDVCERRPVLKQNSSKSMEDVDKRNSILDEYGEEQLLIPIDSLEGSSISKIREKLREHNYNIICINGKTYYVPKSALKEPETKETYGGASSFFESSQTIDWKTVK
ncbi:hypothetical protein Pcinc_035932, partial [Petrolisthes cinctipes]